MYTMRCEASSWLEIKGFEFFSERNFLVDLFWTQRVPHDFLKTFLTKPLFYTCSHNQSMKNVLGFLSNDRTQRHTQSALVTKANWESLMSRDLIYQFLFSVALSHFVFSSSYMQLSCRVLLKRSGIIQSLDFSAISLCCTLRYITLRYVTLRYVTGLALHSDQTLWYQCHFRFSVSRRV